MPAKAFSFAILIPFLLGGCSGGIVKNSFNDLSIADAEPLRVPSGTQVSGCLRTQRDLTVAWSSRRYWCGNDTRRDALIEHNVRMFSSARTTFNAISSETSNNQLHVSPLKRTTYVISPHDRMVASTVNPSQPEMVRYLSVTKQDRDVSKKEAISTTNTTQSVEQKKHDFIRIYFSRNREVLGPMGRKKVISLLSAVKEAKRITLLGLYDADEIEHTAGGPQHEEKFSVGRSLSVRELWRLNGMDISNVTILHHVDDRFGRYVEVTY
jgi:hypothetical protein